MKDGNPSKFIASHVATLPKSGIREFFAIAANMKDAVSLGIGEPDFVTPWHIREAAIFALEKGKTSYTDNPGLRRDGPKLPIAEQMKEAQRLAQEHRGRAAPGRDALDKDDR